MYLIKQTIFHIQPKLSSNRCIRYVIINQLTVKPTTEYGHLTQATAGD